MKYFSYILIALIFILTSCQKDDSKENPNENSIIYYLETDLPTGEQSSDLSLKSGSTYKLNGELIMTEGSILTIESGVTIESTEPTYELPTSRYIIINRGAQIFAEGTKANPIVLTSTNKEPYAWGGLIICGNAPQNESGVYGGESLTPIDNLPYGGSDINDNSGIVKYVRIEFTGYFYTSLIRSVSLFGVGAGTTFEYVSSYNSGHDGFQFFGGTVNPKYLVSIDSGDDGIDFGDGFCGKGEYWFIKNSAKSGVEGSNNKDNGDSYLPMTETRLNNITIIGCGEKPWYFKEGAGKQTINNIVIGGLQRPEKAPYFFANEYDIETAEKILSGDCIVNGIRFYEIGDVEKAVEHLQFTEDENATGAGKGADAPDWAAGWSTPERL